MNKKNKKEYEELKKSIKEAEEGKTKPLSELDKQNILICGVTE